MNMRLFLFIATSLIFFSVQAAPVAIDQSAIAGEGSKRTGIGFTASNTTRALVIFLSADLTLATNSGRPNGYKWIFSLCQGF